MGRHGENIRKRSDGRWEARYIQHYDEFGKAVYRCVYGKTYREAKGKKRVAMSLQAPSKLTNSSKMTFAELVGKWLELKKGSIKESSYAHYCNIINKQIIPELGDVPLNLLKEQQLEQFLRKKLTNGRLDGKGALSNKTVCDIRSILKQILDYAQECAYMPKQHLKLYISAKNNSQIQTFTPKEIYKLEKVLFSKPHPLYFGILISLYAGLRIGEVCALQWKDLNFEEGTVSINKTLLRIPNTDPNYSAKTKVIIERPKTESSNRIIPLPEFLLSYFQHEQMDGDIYFLSGKANYIEPRVCLSNYKRVLKKAEVAEHNFHALRHTFATQCVEKSFDIKSLSEIMGHSNISVTMQRYVHPSMSLKKAQMNRLCSSFDSGQFYGQSESRA